MKNKLILIFLFIIFIGNVYAEIDDVGTGETPILDERKDFSNVIGCEECITGQGVESQKRSNGIELTPTSENAEICINGNAVCIGNMVSQDTAGLPSSIVAKVVEGKVVITKAFFTVNENGEIYTLGGSTFHALPGSRVQYDSESGEPPKVILKETKIPGNNIIGTKEDASLKGKVVYEGRNFGFPDGRVLGIGEVTVDNGKIVGIRGGTTAIINGIEHNVETSGLKISYEENFDPSSSKRKGENYFNYGKNKISLGGKGFTSSFKKGNTIFPEYIENKYEGSFDEKRGILEFTLKGGNLEVIKNSPDSSPLALKIKADGETIIQNGRWKLETDGNRVYADVNRFSRLSADMEFDYVGNGGKSSKYLLETNSFFRNPLNNAEKADIRLEINSLENQITKNKEELFEIITPEILSIEKIENQLEASPYILLKKALKDASPENLARLEPLIEQHKGKYLRLLDERAEYALFDNTFEKYKKLNKETRPLQIEFHKKISIEKFGAFKVGAFGQVLTSDNGDSQVSYAEYIEAFPVIKNTDVKGYKFKNGKLDSTYVDKENTDILAGPLIPDSNFQACADTQIELRALWELEELQKGNQESIKFKISNGKQLVYNPNKGIYTIWNEGQKKIVTKRFDLNVGGNEFKEWMENIQVYSNSGSLRSLPTIKNIDDLKPGDFITLGVNPKSGYGHTKAIKQILLINGQKYYRLFAGSDPVIDARIYSGLLSESQLEDYVKNGAVISRFGEG